MPSRTLERRDLIVGTIIAIIMGTVFSRVGGRPLVATFVPALAVSWLLVLRLYLKRTPLPESGQFFPIYFSTLAWQFIHFAEEFATGFNESFPQLYGAASFSPALFVGFNMVSYFVFVLACLLMFTGRLHFLVIPVMFFLVYGAIGNAIAHTWWVVQRKSYFSGFFTAQAYWVLGPLALSRLMGSRRDALAAVLVLALVLVPIMTLLMRPR